MSAIYSLLSAARTQERNLESTANNIANVNTTGFKADRSVFKEFLKSSLGTGQPSTLEEYGHNSLAEPSQIGETRYAITDDTVIDTTAGGYKQTGNNFDFAIKGDGFFTVETPYGNRFTRDGSFLKSADGFLTDVSGNFVLGNNGRIPVIGEKINVTEDGFVSIDGLFVDKLRVSDFEQPEKLTKAGSNYFKQSENQIELVNNSNFQIKQGMLEQANVTLVKEMTQLISTNRSFDAAQRGIKTMDDIDAQSLLLAR